MSKEVVRKTPPSEREAEKSTTIPLYTNPTLKQIVDQIPSYTANIEDINRIAREFGKRDYSKIKDRKKLMGIIAEYHLYYALEKLKEIFPEINLSPIEDQAKRDGYKFQKQGINYKAFWGQNDDSCEYDILSEIDRLPVIWEVKLGKLNGATGNRRISTILKPLMSYYRNNRFGYVIVAPGNFITPHPEFEERGGLLVPFYVNQDKFADDICSVPKPESVSRTIFDRKTRNVIT